MSFHVECPLGCDIPWERCPWCDAVGVPHAVMRECRAWSKGDLMCAMCGCDHGGVNAPHRYQVGWLDEPCPSACVEFVVPLSPCEEWLKERR